MYWSQVRILAGPPAFLIIQLGCATRWYTARIRLEIVFSFIFFSSIDLTPRLNSNVLHSLRKFVQIYVSFLLRKDRNEEKKKNKKRNQKKN